MSDNDEIELNKATSKSTKRPTSQKISTKVAKKKKEDRELDILEGLAQSLNNPLTQSPNSDISEIDCFCQYIAKSLKKFDKRTQNVVKNGIQNLIFQSEMGNATTPMAGSVVPVAPQVYYHQPVQPPHIPNTSGDHNTGTLYEAMHDAVNMNW